ncbi:MAG: TIGR03617 family F420-dependent LLM class oxidoreductase [Acidobacteriota bacterium]|nr:TIGR03617 family F420-dependent LLM class oxidoreductase [Acidobacteriota bacterium]
MFTTLPQARLPEVGAAAVQAERDGYDGVVTLDNRHDPFLPLAIAAVSTERVELATGIAVAFPRSPMVTAMQAWDLQTASQGRFVLGLGSQIKPHVERRFSTAWSAPAPRLREYVQALRAIWRTWADGERLDFHGEHYNFTLMPPNFTPEPLDGPSPAVTVAAVGPRMLAMAAEQADGVRLHAFCTRRYLEQTVKPLLEERLARQGRARSSFQISGGGFVCTGPDDESVAEQVEWVRMRVGFYGSTPAYWPVLEAHDLGDLGRHLRELTRQGKWDELPRQVSDDVVHLFAAVGRHDQLADAVSERFGGVSDAIGASASPDRPGGLPPDLISDLQAIPTRFAGFSLA